MQGVRIAAVAMSKIGNLMEVQGKSLLISLCTGGLFDLHESSLIKTFDSRLRVSRHIGRLS